jgi:flagellin-like hook-associated protein FlgL
MASNVARNLSNHYSSLSNSVRKLSSGLRINSSADDAAGLAIRELMRADIAALNQGVRNVNDAISMLQTADGALSVIDEKLIRMKELAEQASTGTYNSDQRLMINSEFHAMAAEIERIANATDFNGVKLLCEDAANKIITKDAKMTNYDIAKDFYPAINNETIIINKNAIKESDIQFLNIKKWYFLNISKYSGDNSIELYSSSGISDVIGSTDLYDGEYTLQYISSTDTWGLISSTTSYFQFYDIVTNNSGGVFINGYSD